MAEDNNITFDFKGLGYSKIGHFKQVRSKIEELENLSRELAQRHNELEAIINNMTDGLTILDKELNIVFVNKVQETMFPAEHWIGKKCFNVFYHREARCKECPVLTTIETEKTLRGEIVIEKAECAGRCFEWTTSPIKDASGRVTRVILLMRDITERKEYEFNLMRADRMAAIGLLAAGIAHEINNPLTSIAGFSEGLLKRLKTYPEFKNSKMSAYFQDYLHIINNEAYRCKDIIQNLIRFSQKKSDDHEKLSLDKIIADTASLIRQHAKDNGIKIVTKGLDENEPHWIIGNESELKHLFLNLFNNSLESMEDGETLTILMKNSAGSIEVVISHKEKEEPAEPQMESLHSPHTAKPGAGGTPLSLSICYSIMQHHEGDIQVNNAAGRGATFNLRFPAVSA